MQTKSDIFRHEYAIYEKKMDFIHLIHLNGAVSET